MTKILLAMPEDSVRSDLRRALVRDGYVVETEGDGQAVATMARVNVYDLILLDAALSRMNGWQICRLLRGENAQTPIIMTAASPAANLRVAGLDMGADDFLSRPFTLAEIRARIRAVLRRTGGHRALKVTAGSLELNQTRRKIYFHSEEMTLSPKEFGALEMLIRRAGQVITRAEFVESLWADTLDATLSHRLENIISQLRKKLGNREAIKPHTGRGYELVVGEVG